MHFEWYFDFLLFVGIILLHKEKALERHHVRRQTRLGLRKNLRRSQRSSRNQSHHTSRSFELSKALPNLLQRRAKAPRKHLLKRRLEQRNNPSQRRRPRNPRKQSRLTNQSSELSKIMLRGFSAVLCQPQISQLTPRKYPLVLIFYLF